MADKPPSTHPQTDTLANISSPYNLILKLYNDFDKRTEKRGPFRPALVYYIYLFSVLLAGGCVFAVCCKVANTIAMVLEVFAICVCHSLPTVILTIVF